MKISLRAARVNAKMTQEDVAKVLHKGKQTILSWEKGKTSIDAANLMALCRLYKVSEDDIILPSSKT